MGPIFTYQLAISTSLCCWVLSLCPCYSCRIYFFSGCEASIQPHQKEWILLLECFSYSKVILSHRTTLLKKSYCKFSYKEYCLILQVISNTIPNRAVPIIYHFMSQRTDIISSLHLKHFWEFLWEQIWDSVSQLQLTLRACSSYSQGPSVRFLDGYVSAITPPLPSALRISWVLWWNPLNVSQSLIAQVLNF